MEGKNDINEQNVILPHIQTEKASVKLDYGVYMSVYFDLMLLVSVSSEFPDQMN